MPVRIGLTGSIGMGKSTTAKIFAEQGIPVWDADAAVTRLYAQGGAAVAAVGALHESAVRDGAVDRDALKSWIATDPTALARLEAVVHPLVQADRARFVAENAAPVLVFDIPLLFETGGDAEMDLIVVVSTTLENQKERVMARPGMTPDLFDRMLAKQVPDAEKRRRADHVIDTATLETARAGVQSVLDAIARTHSDA